MERAISIWITPKSYLKAPGLALDKDYKRVRDEHRPQLIHYINEDVGIEYNVDEETGLVGLVKYLPAAADKALRCSKPRNLLSETIEVAQYSNISLAAEKRILHKFAKQIIRYTSINYASAQAFIFVYDDEQFPSRDSRMRAERVKEYLVNTHHIDPDRISILKAGNRKKLTIKLYLVPPGASPPRLGSLIFQKPDVNKHPTLA